MMISSSKQSSSDDNTCIPLMLTLNADASTNLLFENLRNSLAFHYPQLDKNDLVKFVLSKSSRQAVVFVGNREIANLLLTSEKDFAISGPLSASFKPIDSMKSEIVIIHRNSFLTPETFSSEVETLCRENFCECSAMMKRREEILLVLSATSKHGLNNFVEHLISSTPSYLHQQVHHFFSHLEILNLYNLRFTLVHLP